MDCPCGSGADIETCCGPLLSGEQTAETAEQLMRSRYTAYTYMDTGYLLATWHTSTRPAGLDLEAEPTPQWLGLKIVNCSGGRPDNRSATVEFVARYKINGRAKRLHEVSRFAQENGHWYYLDGRLD